ncbi:MAG TPA: hypothetical protein VF665_18830 [Longimicrobium sp.]|jgi:hypothetical protein|uniref:hypothetical protein n=1 Tax=Longimicrobium sp. TaxID=2029185 RepID=UPI002EDB1F37
MTEARPMGWRRCEPIVPHWSRYLMTVAFAMAVLATCFLGFAELAGVFAPETGSTRALAPPCPATPAQRPTMVLRDSATGFSITVPRGTWKAAAWARSNDGAGWRDAASGDVVYILAESHFPGRPRIEHGGFHGLAELERCREPRGRDSAWIASGHEYGHPSGLSALLLAPDRAGRWLYARAVTRGDVDRQREWLAAVRTARLDRP